LNKFCDNDDFVGLTKRINGGTIGIEDRKHHYELALKLLG
jgi:putative chitinase